IARNGASIPHTRWLRRTMRPRVHAWPRRWVWDASALRTPRTTSSRSAAPLGAVFIGGNGCLPIEGKTIAIKGGEPVERLLQCYVAIEVIGPVPVQTSLTLTLDCVPQLEYQRCPGFAGRVQSALQVDAARQRQGCQLPGLGGCLLPARHKRLRIFFELLHLLIPAVAAATIRGSPAMGTPGRRRPTVSPRNASNSKGLQKRSCDLCSLFVHIVLFAGYKEHIPILGGSFRVPCIVGFKKGNILVGIRNGSGSHVLRLIEAPG